MLRIQDLHLSHLDLDLGPVPITLLHPSSLLPQFGIDEDKERSILLVKGNPGIESLTRTGRGNQSAIYLRKIRNLTRKSPQFETTTALFLNSSFPGKHLVAMKCPMSLLEIE